MRWNSKNVYGFALLSFTKKVAKRFACANAVSLRPSEAQKQEGNAFFLEEDACAPTHHCHWNTSLKSAPKTVTLSPRVYLPPEKNSPNTSTFGARLECLKQASDCAECARVVLPPYPSLFSASAGWRRLARRSATTVPVAEERSASRQSNEIWPNFPLKQQKKRRVAYTHKKKKKWKREKETPRMSEEKQVGVAPQFLQKWKKGANQTPRVIFSCFF